MNRIAVRWLVLAVVVICFPAASFAQLLISVSIGPPALPMYAQPMCPGPGYFWTPGYWAWNDDAGYYWVPGTWVMAPAGLLWTPGYWGWGGGYYYWHPGYWGPHVGFYGGINYGYGYGGAGFAGGEWRGGSFYYNRSVTNVSTTNVTNVYNTTVINNNTTVNNVSYNGGTGGVQAKPTAQEQLAANEQHTAPLAEQTQHETMASQNRQNFASVNQGKPAIAATSRAGDFSSRSAVPARSAGAEYHAPAISPKEARGPSMPAKSAASSNSAMSNQGFRPFTAPNSNNAASQPNNKPAAAPANNPPKPNNSQSAPRQQKSNPPPPPPKNRPNPHQFR